MTGFRLTVRSSLTYDAKHVYLNVITDGPGTSHHSLSPCVSGYSIKGQIPFGLDPPANVFVCQWIQGPRSHVESSSFRFVSRVHTTEVLPWAELTSRYPFFVVYCVGLCLSLFSVTMD